MILVMMIGCLVIPTSGSTAEAASKKLKVTCSKKTVTVGSSIKIKTNVKATFKSSNKKIATVSSKGVVKGKKAGKVKITVTSKQNKKQKKTVKITVKKKPKTVETSTTTETPNTTAPTTEQPTTETPTVEQPTTEQPTTEKPTTEQQLTTEESTTEQPSTQEPTIVGIEAKYRGDKVPNDLDLITVYGMDLKFVCSDGTKKDVDINVTTRDNITYTKSKEETVDGKKYVTYKVCYNNYETEMKIQVVDLDESIIYPVDYWIEYTGETLKEGETPNLDDISVDFYDSKYNLLEIEKDNSKFRLIKFSDSGTKYKYAIPYDYYFTDDNGNELYICIWSRFLYIPYE